MLQEKRMYWLTLSLLALIVVMAVALSLLRTGGPAAGPTLPPPEANPFTEADFVLIDGRMQCLSADTMAGIDVSSWQDRIDWQKVKDSGIEFVMIRLARRGSTEGGLYEDENARRNYEGAREAGLKVGGYFFSQAINTREAEEEARFVLDMVSAWQLDMPLVFDWEFTSSPARTDAVDSRTLTDCALAFCRVVEEAGLQPMIYFNSHISIHNMYLEELTDYPFWLAQYADTMDYPYRVQMWQYTDQGAVDGIPGAVDLNLYFLYE